MTEGTNAGEYEATFTPKGDYVWSDGTQDARTVTWTIKRKTVQMPAQSGSLTYTGSAQSPTWDNYSAVEPGHGRHHQRHQRRELSGHLHAHKQFPVERRHLWG